MSRARAESIVYYHTENGALPDVEPRYPWTKEGSQIPTIVSAGLRLDDNSGVEVLRYYRQLVDADTILSASRYADDVWAQARIQGLEDGAGWASGASPIGLFIDDGTRKIALSIGNTLRLIDPDTGDVVKVISTNHPWLEGIHYMLKKVGSARWDAFVAGRRVASISYDLAPASSGAPARAGFGSLDASGTSDAIFEGVEVTCNLAAPPQWIVDKTQTTLGPLTIASLTKNDRAVLRTIVGQYNHIRNLMEEAFASKTAERIDRETFEASGDQLAELEDPAWTKTDAGAQISVLRERLKFDCDGTQLTHYDADFSTPGVALPGTSETTGRAVFIVRDYTADADGRIGPYIQIHDGTREITAQLALVNTTQPVWALTTGVLTGAVSFLGTQWHVDPTQEHRVEVQVLAPDWVLLLVDRQVVDRLPYTDFGASATAPQVRIGAYGPAGAVSRFEVANMLGVQRVTDLKKREVFEQNMLEREIFTSGCDRNDELDTWGHAHFEVQQLRGTTLDIILEMQRIACCQDVRFAEQRTFAGWFLEESYPETTPIFLEASGELLIRTLEFCNESPNFTDQALANLAKRYFVPISTLDLRYQIARAVLTNGAQSTPSAGVSRLPVDSVTPFTVGDSVDVRLIGTPDTFETVIVLAVQAAAIDVESLGVVYPVGSVVRKILATT